VFFFEKKNQKTLDMAPGASAKAASSVLPQRSKSFLVLFFKKERFSW